MMLMEECGASVVMLMEECRACDAVPGSEAVLLMEECGCESRGQQESVCWKLFSRCLLFCMRLYSCLMLLRICSGRQK